MIKQSSHLVCLHRLLPQIGFPISAFEKEFRKIWRSYARICIFESFIADSSLWKLRNFPTM